MDLSEHSQLYNFFSQIIKYETSLDVEVLVGVNEPEPISDRVLIKDVYYDDGKLLVKYFSNNFQIILIVPYYYFKTVLSHPIENFLDSDLFQQLLSDKASDIDNSLNLKNQEKLKKFGVIPMEDQVFSFQTKNFSDQNNNKTGIEGKFVFSVTALTEQIKHLLVRNFYSIWVKGEVHDCKRSSNGHVFFNLRDGNASLSCVIYAQQLKHIKFEIQRGIVFECYGNITLYEKRGIYQLIVERLSPEGQGDLDLAFNQLNEKLNKEGLFAPERKKPIPKYAERVGLITSAKGAALTDILKTTEVEFYNLDIVVLPCLVQGDKASESIARMIQYANEEKSLGLDLIVLTRGGGSREDLWAFNEEITARAIFKSDIPIISAIGHEVDWTIADLVADYRCATPTAAAIFICKGKKDLQQEIFLLNQSLRRNLKIILEGIKYRLKLFSRQNIFQKLLRTIDLKRKNTADSSHRLKYVIRQNILEKSNQMSIIKGRLISLSPQRVFERGYMVLKKNENLVTDLSTLQSGDLVKIISLNKFKQAKIQ